MRRGVFTLAAVVSLLSSSCTPQPQRTSEAPHVRESTSEALENEAKPGKQPTSRSFAEKGLASLSPGSPSGTFRYTRDIAVDFGSPEALTVVVFTSADFREVQVFKVKADSRDVWLSVDLRPGSYFITVTWLAQSKSAQSTTFPDFHIDKDGVLYYPFGTGSRSESRTLRAFPSFGPRPSVRFTSPGVRMAVEDWTYTTDEVQVRSPGGGAETFRIRLAEPGDAPMRPVLFVRAILPDSPAIDAGLLPGDVIDQINGKPVEAGADMNGQADRFITQIRSLPRGTLVKLRVLREGEQPREVEMKLAGGR